MKWFGILRTDRKVITRAGIVRLAAEDVIRLFMRHNPLMRTSVSLYHRHRFPTEIIGHSVWLYFRFALSFRDVEEMLAMRGVSLSYETVREWCLEFGQTYADGLRHAICPARDHHRQAEDYQAGWFRQAMSSDC